MQTPEAAQADAGEVYDTPFFFVLDGVDQKGSLYLYAPDSKGAFGPRDKIFDGDGIGDFTYLKAAAQVDNDKDGYSDATYYGTDEGVLSYTCTNADGEVKTRRIGGGWDIYAKVLSPGSIGGAKESDILAVDKAGVLWTYPARPDGTVTPRGRVGAGWNTYNPLRSNGDLDRDGTADLLARAADGSLSFHRDTARHPPRTPSP
ncbi:hypothetical protein QOM21_09425 [Streptomyces sp. Pv4-95]|uniref:hypothetical protein n=1 Tax=Streptomyces sp. Pv4-95 TaxID=3049543 RepID=UPI003891758D